MLAVPATAWAHSPIPGLDGIYAGALHPLLVPGHVLALLALPLVMGGGGLPTYRAAVPSYLVALPAGLALGSWWPGPGYAPAALLATLALALLAAADARPRPAWTATLAAAVGMLLAADTLVDAHAGGSPGRLAAGATIGLAFLGLVGADLVRRHRRPWQVLVGQVLGSWLAACAMLVLAWRLSGR